MHNLALALQQKGDHITGSDDAIFEPSRSRLKAHGLLPAELGWFPDRIHEFNRNAPNAFFEHKTRVVIGGSHGKTTITSMILHVLKYHGI